MVCVDLGQLDLSLGGNLHLLNATHVPDIVLLVLRLGEIGEMGVQGQQELEQSHPVRQQLGVGEV
ncbi:MAG: hypothetical protein ACK559_28040, partial [bacterium]